VLDFKNFLNLKRLQLTRLHKSAHTGFGCITFMIYDMILRLKSVIYSEQLFFLWKLVKIIHLFNVSYSYLYSFSYA